MEELDLPSTLTTSATIQERKTRAAQSQEPFLTYADSADGIEVKNQFWLVNAVLVEVDRNKVDITDLTSQDGVTELHANFEVESPDPVDEGNQTTTDDAATTEYETTYGLDQVNATEVWDEHGTRGAGVKVAVLDTGVDASHPDIDLYTDDPGNETYPGGWAEFNDAGEQVEDSTPHDSAYHGTHVSGTVAGGAESGEHIGVAPDADLMHGMVLKGGSGSFAQIIGGMEWAVEEDADVISMSLGAGGYYEQMIDPVRTAEEAGVLVVAAAGNDGLGTTGSPGNVYESFAIGAADEEANIAYFSGGETVNTADAWGSAAPAEWPAEYIVPDVAGPGVAVKSTYPVNHDDGPYHEISGTSMATPHVSGVAALMLSAAGRDAPPSEVRQIMEETAWKPEGESTEKDVRYGHGIVDAKAATDQIAANSGIEGTVEDATGAPITDAIVEFENASQWTEVDENGSYMIRAMPGEYTVTISAFGYQTTTQTVNITEETFVQQNVTLGAALDARVLEAQPEGLEAGETLETTLEVANVENVTVNLVGNYSASDATLTVDGQQATFGEPVAFNESQSGELPIAVETTAAANGTIELAHTFEGLNETTTATSGSTVVFEEAIPVAVVDTESGVYSQGVVEALDEQLPPWYEIDRITPDKAADSLTSIFTDEYEVYAVQNLTDDAGSAETFIEEAKAPDVGVVYLDQFGTESAGVSQHAAATGDPEEVVDSYSSFNYPVEYVVTEAHPIFDGVAAQGETVELYDPEAFWGYDSFHTYFTGYDGDYDPQVLADVQAGWSASGPGLAVDDVTRTVHAASLGHTAFTNGNDYEEDADRILANAVEYARLDSPVAPTSEQPTHIEPNESTTVEFEADNVDSITVELSAESTLDEADLTLSVRGNETEFGTPVAFNGTVSGTHTVEVTANESAVGKFGLTTSVALTDNGESKETTIQTGPTSVYESPLRVPEDVDTVAEAADIVVEDDELVLGNGTYDEHVAIDVDGLTIRAAANASPTIRVPSDRSWDDPYYVLHLAGDDMTLDGVNISGSNPDLFYYAGDALAVSGDNPTVTNSSVTGGNVGIRLEHPDEFGVHPANITIRDVTVRDATNVEPAGAVAGKSPGATVENLTVEDSTIGITLTDSPNATVRNSSFRNIEESGIRYEYSIEASGTIENNDVKNAATGVTLWYDNDAVVTNNTVTNVTTGFDLGSGGNPELLAQNDIEEAGTGFELDTALNGGGTLTENDVDAELGVNMTGTAPEQVEFVYNDLSGVETAVRSTSDEPFDVRQNFYGPDGPVPAQFDGDVVYDPYLTQHPDEINATPAETTALESQVYVEAGDVYAVGIPGPTESTIGDMVRADFEGAIYGFDAQEQQWTHLTGADTVDALDALAVVAESDGVLALNFQSKDMPRAPSQQTLVEGWNFVTVPEYGPMNASFASGSAEPTVAMRLHEQPHGQLGPKGDLDSLYHMTDVGEAPMASPFEGYFVFAKEEGTVPAYLPSDPTMAELYGALGYEDPVNEPPSAENRTIDEVLDRTAGTTATTAALKPVIRAELEAAMAESPSETHAALNASASELVAQVPASHDDHDLVVTVTKAIVEDLLQEEFDGRPVDAAEKPAGQPSNNTAVTVPAVSAGTGLAGV